MPTFIRDPLPVEMVELIERRRRLGQDRFDEVWDGVLHMNPAPAGRHGQIEAQLLAIVSPPAGLTLVAQFNLGEDEQNYRVPDAGLLRDFSDRVFYPTAALVIEIVSPGDESYRKFDFYAVRGVEEVVIVDPQERVVRWFGLTPEGYEPIAASRLIELGPDELAVRVDWP